MTTTASAICAASASSQRPHRAPACRVNVQLTSTSALQRGMLPYFAFRPWRWHRLEANSISFPMVYCETCGSAEKLVKNGSKSVVNSTTLFAFLQPMSVAEFRTNTQRTSVKAVLIGPERVEVIHTSHAPSPQPPSPTAA